MVVHLVTIIGMLSSAWPAFSQHLIFEKEFRYNYITSDSGLGSVGEHLRYARLFDVPTSHQSKYLQQMTVNMPPGVEQHPPYLTSGKKGINYKRAGFLSTANAGAIIYGFRQAISSWGESKGEFHLKNDWKGDNLAQIDELSHFLWGYKMTQFLFWSYRWAGFSSKVSHIISISQTALVLTMVEYPVDAYNPKQGLGLSDLVFDYAGIGLACLKHSFPWMENFDVKISSKNNIFLGKQPLFAQTYGEFDNFIYWLTYKHKLYLPQKVLCFGLGYGVTHRHDVPQRELLVGVGLSLPDFISLFHENLGRRLKFLELFYPNLNMEL
jgi:hypothetical protein